MFHRTNPYWYEQEADIGGPDIGSPQTITVSEEETDTFTGLYDGDGNPLHRDRLPMGFIR